MYNQVYSRTTQNPLYGEHFHHNENINAYGRGGGQQQFQPIPIEVKKTFAVKIGMSIEKKSIELVVFLFFLQYFLK